MCVWAGVHASSSSIVRSNTPPQLAARQQCYYYHRMTTNVIQDIDMMLMVVEMTMVWETFLGY